MDEKTLREKVWTAANRWARSNNEARHTVTEASLKALVGDVVVELLPPQETVTWMVGSEVRLAWPERKVMVVSAPATLLSSWADVVEGVGLSVRKAVEMGKDLLILDLRSVTP